MSVSNPLHKIRIGAQLAIGFGVVIFIAAGIGFIGWNRLSRVRQLVTVTDDAGTAVKDMLNARREEKNVMLRGSQKFGADGKSSVEKWEALKQRLLDQLQELQSSPELDEAQQRLVADAIAAAEAYAAAFMANRTAQEQSTASWKDIGWAVTRNVEKATAEVIVPSREAAAKAKDSDHVAQWFGIERELDNAVIKPFLLLRTTAVYAISTKGDKEWETYEGQLDKTLRGSAAWSRFVQAKRELKKHADAIGSQLEAYKAAGAEFRKSVLQARETETVLVAKARDVESVCERLQAELGDRMHATMNRAVAAMIVMALAGIVLGVVFSVVIARSIANPVRACVANVEEVAKGKLRQTIPPQYLERKDEVGAMARALARMIDNFREIVGGIGNNSQSLADASAELAATASQLATGAEQTTNQSGQVAAAAEEMSTNMNTMAASTEQMSANVKVVASAVEELTASISEVARSAEQAASVAQNAAQLVGTSNAQIGELGGAAEQIGKVIEVIQDIAEQTNLLALNATIEAARAGEAGKGFAVVATEVKELARQTAGATEDIRKRIEGIQTSTGQAVQSIGDISGVIERVNELSRTIASAVEEQSITTKEIAKNVAESSSVAQSVARGVAESASASQEITRTITGVDQAAKQSAQGAAQTQSSGHNLSQMAEQLQSLVARFSF
jgi:methyl-accepting chemotaxis protein